ALRRAAATGIARLVALVRIGRTLVLVVVDELLPRLDRPDRLYVDVAAVDHGLAVRIAGVIDEARLVPVHGRVYHRAVVEREQEGVAALHLVVIVATVGLRVRDALSHVLDEAGPLPDASGGQGAASLNGRRADLEV